MWPYRRCSTAISLTLSSIKHKHLVYFTIAIPIVLREIDALSGCPQTSLSYHLASMKVVASISISSIIGTWVLQWTDTYDIKVEFELSSTLRLEVILHAAFESIVGIVLSIGYLVVQSAVVTTLKLRVGKLSQDDQSLLRALENISNICLSPHCATVVGLGSTCHSLATRIRELAIRINLISCRSSIIEITCSVRTLVIVHKLIANQLHLDLCAISKRNGAPDSWLGGYCHCR